MITIKLDVTKLQKNRFIHGKKGGIYVDLILIEHPNDFGDDGFVAQSVSKEERDQGIKGPIAGNWRETNKKTVPPVSVRQAPMPQRPPPNPQRELIEDDDIPF